MHWPWPPPTRGDVLGILFLLFFIIVAAIGVIWKPFPLTSWGFGPDCDCVYAPHSEPICVKRVPSK